MAAFEVGQRVKVIGSIAELELHGAAAGFNQTGIVEEIDETDPTDATIRVFFAGITRWFKPEHLELIPDIGKQPDTPTPLLQQRNEQGGVMTVRHVLLKYGDLATKQPHLFFAGYYRSDIYDLEQFAKDTPRFILMSTIACSNAAIGGSEMQPYHIVFVIAEELKP